jgi:hypothetical protein
VQEIELEEEMDWEEGDVIVVASTDYDAAQCEPRKITAVDGKKFSLSLVCVAVLASVSHWLLHRLKADARVAAAGHALRRDLPG